MDFIESQDSSSTEVELTGAELIARLGASLRGGTVLDLRSGFIPADLIRDVLLGRRLGGRDEPVIELTDIDPRGLLISNAVIEGHLDLDNMEIKAAVSITQSSIPLGISLNGARFHRGLDLSGCTIDTLDLTGAHIEGELNLGGVRLTGADEDGNSLRGDRLKVDGNMILDEGFATTTGAISLAGADLTGTLDLSGAQLVGVNQDGLSLVGDGLQVGIEALLEDGFMAAGAVSLISASITAQLTLSGAQLTGADKDGNSFRGDDLQVGGTAFFDDGFTATTGAVRLSGANITGRLNFSRAQLNGADQHGHSLVADNLQVGGDAFLDDGLTTTTGAVQLHGANITGQLNLRKAQLTGTNKDGDSLVADTLQVGGDAFLDDGFTATGAVRMYGANVSGQLVLRGAQITGADQDGDSLVADNLKVGGDAFLDNGFTAAGAVRLNGARITGQLSVPAVGVPAGGISSPGLNLTGATLDDLRINLRGIEWSSGSKVRPDVHSLPAQRVVLSLENCIYKHRPDPALGGLETWLRVLRFHTPDYQPRSYQQLAAVHRATGHDRDAGRILMAQQDHRRAVALRPKSDATPLHRIGLWATRTGLAIWKATLGYGYRPRRALAWLMALLATAGLLVTLAAHWPADPTTPDVPVAYRPANLDTGTPLGYCSAGEAAGLAVRIAIPLVTNIGQGACLINTASTPGSWIVTISIVLQTFAWILGGLTVAAAATAIKRSP